MLETASAAELNEHLQGFILEANRQDGFLPIHPIRSTS